MTDEGTVNLPTAVTKAYDLLLWLINHVGKFPRSHRFVLGDRIESRMLTVLEAFISHLLRPHVCPMNRRGFKCHCVATFVLLLLMIVFPSLLWAQDIAQVKKGVVKITAQVEGKNKTGSGIIVKLEGDHVYIVTASHACH